MDIKVIASGSTGNATKISDGATSLLLDAGVSVNKLFAGSGFAVSDAHGCFITHEHGDHSCAAKPIAKLGVNVYASAGTFDKLNVSGHRFRIVKPLEAVTVGTFGVMPFDVTHDAAEPLGFLVKSNATGEKLVYFSDTAYVKYTFTGITHLVAECNHGEAELRQSVRSGAIEAELAKRIARSHMSLERLVDFVETNDKSRLKQVYLIHLSDGNSDADRFKREIQGASGAEVYVC